MKSAIVGYTGFVGSNIYEKGCFDGAYNSKNIQEAFGTKPDILVYAGLRAEKFLANNAPEKDMELILEAEENIKKIAPKKLVLISTVDVFKNPVNMDENSSIDTEGLHAYGYNRYQLELWARAHYKDCLIIRLPGLFGKNIKKNFIFDMIRIIPSMLKKEKMDELCGKDSSLLDYYTLQENGFYKVLPLDCEPENILRQKFLQVGFSAVNFTDSRSVYQFYPLSHLWSDIQLALENNITLWHPATEPICAGELHSFVTGKAFVNEMKNPPVVYDYKTCYAEVFGGKDGYICDKNSLLGEIKDFIGSFR